MEDKQGAGLRHIRTGSALAPGTMRSGIVARGRRDAAATNSHYRQAVEHRSSGNLQEAVASLRLAAGQGHAESQYLLSTLMEAGDGVLANVAEAALWERKAAEQNHAYAQANVSFRYYTAGEFNQAFQWCERAAGSGLAWAQFYLGLMYRKGEGVARSDTDAARLYTLAASQDFVEAQQKLAELYSLGLGVVQSYALAASWYRKAAAQGHAEAQYQLAQLYAVGQGVEPDYVQARHWIRKAALQGHPQALCELKQREYRDA